MKALITGGAGFIGSNLVDELLARGDNVCVLDCLTTGSIHNIKHHLSDKNFTFVNDDILNEKLVDELVKNCDIVYHLAAVVGVKIIVSDPLKTMLVNVRGTDNIFISAYRHWKKVVIVSTSEIYGKSVQVPLIEDDDRILGSTAIDRWSYSASKSIDEHIAFAYSKKGLPVIILRFFNSYGPRINEQAYGTVVAQFIKQALKGEDITVHSNGEQTRCFTYVEDTVDGIIKAGQTSEAEGDVFNLGSNTENKIIELAEMIKTLTNSKSKIINIPYSDYYGQSYEDTKRRVPCIEKAKNILKFEAKIPLREGLTKTIKWWKEAYKGY